VLSGDDFVTYPMLAVGAVGVISVTANVAPADVTEMCEAHFSGDAERARSLHYKLRPLNRAMFIETNPIPAKTTLALMGKIGGEFRSPLCPPSEANLAKIRQAAEAYGLLPARAGVSG
ncbi:MAG: dihydrodipicolinate synthase family protein, partial [Nitrospinota bacterium]